ncbi:hypothetical protein K505DRAFT_8523 [Melanomma pulvis-pyrius CBS 109.77]|uniref:Uncharacterized protein n=1 Tax=Melanomma pulvis-pyrius CBS 109.77 TaxID=1314802 RepID=A0A6A6XHN9_9PLEO|nr:hypothetical protein K505DRAFT_8523 [Melanomma pulvis-pyrius CBS 109.77]
MACTEPRNSLAKVAEFTTMKRSEGIRHGVYSGETCRARVVGCLSGRVSRLSGCWTCQCTLRAYSTEPGNRRTKRDRPGPGPERSMVTKEGKEWVGCRAGNIGRVICVPLKSAGLSTGHGLRGVLRPQATADGRRDDYGCNCSVKTGMCWWKNARIRRRSADRWRLSEIKSECGKCRSDGRRRRSSSRGRIECRGVDAI